MERPRVFELTGGRLCLDFVNTVEHRPTVRAQELIESYADLVAWSRQSRVLSSREARALLARSRKAPRRARKVLLRARALREALFAVFSRSSKPVLGALRRELPRAYRRPVLHRQGAIELRWKDAPETLDGMLGPVVRSAVELLSSRESARVRVCAAPDCDWVFLDESRSRSRQWCSMAVCGNRAKARRFYRRRRGTK